jgi:hypothetical protein
LPIHHLSLTARPPDDTVLAALLACHERIHRFTALAARLATTDGTPAERAEAAAGVVRYFTVALPLHAADEDDSLAPRLRGRDAAVDAALATMTAEHVAHAGPLAAVVDAARAVVAAPATVPPDLAAAADALAALFADPPRARGAHDLPGDRRAARRRPGHDPRRDARAPPLIARRDRRARCRHDHRHRLARPSRPRPASSASIAPPSATPSICRCGTRCAAPTASSIAIPTCESACSTPTAITSPAASTCRSGRRCSRPAVAHPRRRPRSRSASPARACASRSSPRSQGTCLTIGIELLLATDVRLCADSARFGQIEIKRGIYPVGGATLRFPREVGWANAMRWLLTGE